MLPEDRRQRILDLIETDGFGAVDDLSKRFDVSEMTIRRDLDALESEGLIKRVYGGATSNRGRSYEPPFFLRKRKLTAVKERIGRRAAELITGGDSVALDVGTTTLEIARHLDDRHNLTVVTPSLPVANLLAGQPDIRLILAGGIVRPRELSLVGHLAEHAFDELHVDKLFLGIAGIDFETGLTEFNMEDAQVKRAMLGSASECIVVADATKFGRTTFAAVAKLDSVDRIVTDESIRRETVDRLLDMDVEVILA
jgi:DeoR/GlpR family transcriptional regulator of sugar metabolism